MKQIRNIILIGLTSFAMIGLTTKATADAGQCISNLTFHIDGTSGCWTYGSCQVNVPFQYLSEIYTNGSGETVYPALCNTSVGACEAEVGLSVTISVDGSCCRSTIRTICHFTYDDGNASNHPIPNLVLPGGVRSITYAFYCAGDAPDCWAGFVECSRDSCDAPGGCMLDQKFDLLLDKYDRQRFALLSVFGRL